MLLNPTTPAALWLNGTTVLIPVNRFGLRERIEALGEAWIRKPELHLSVLDLSWIAERTGSELEPLLIATAHAVSALRGPLRIASSDELRMVEHERRRTIVEMCTVAGLERFYASFTRHSGIPLAPVPTHLTLYSNDGHGIWLRDPAELEARSRPLTAAEAGEIARASLAPRA